jgi:hypothetical protein
MEQSGPSGLEGRLQGMGRRAKAGKGGERKREDRIGRGRPGQGRNDPKARARSRGPDYKIKTPLCSCGGERVVGGEASSAGHGQEVRLHVCICHGRKAAACNTTISRCPPGYLSPTRRA